MLMASSLSFIRLFFPGEEYKWDGQWTKGYAHGAPEDRVGATSFGDRVADHSADQGYCNKDSYRHQGSSPDRVYRECGAVVLPPLKAHFFRRVACPPCPMGGCLTL